MYAHIHKIKVPRQQRLTLIDKGGHVLLPLQIIFVAFFIEYQKAVQQPLLPHQCPVLPRLQAPAAHKGLQLTDTFDNGLHADPRHPAVNATPSTDT